MIALVSTYQHIDTFPEALQVYSACAPTLQNPHAATLDHTLSNSNNTLTQASARPRLTETRAGRTLSTTTAFTTHRTASFCARAQRHAFTGQPLVSVGRNSNVAGPLVSPCAQGLKAKQDSCVCSRLLCPSCITSSVLAPLEPSHSKHRPSS